ncbi:uncharacterized protein LOC135109457 [Scylla paramamosain]|uniref:uncharacterized protein LOC135109457 n=1 Tax=Scylla paramamosain TaxID=85552 RepID=UPI003082A9B0
MKKLNVIYLLWFSAAVIGQNGNEDLGNQMLSHIAKTQLTNCHVVMLIPKQHQLSMQSLVGSQISKGMVMMTNSVDEKLFFKALYGDLMSACRGLILHIGKKMKIVSEMLRLLERAGLWKFPHARVTIIGRKTTMRTVFLHSTFRNTVHAVYLAIHDHSSPKITTLPQNIKLHAIEKATEVTVYRRCLHCNNSEIGFHFIGRSRVSSESWQDDVYLPYDEQFHSLNGQRLKIVSIKFFPFIDYERDTNTPGTTVTPRFSIDAYLISTFEKKLNFSYNIWEEIAQSWGRIENGSFTGMMGQLQREDADFGTMSGPTPDRFRVMDHVRAYPSDPVTVISLKPSLLPQHLAIIRPFAGFRHCFLNQY